MKGESSECIVRVKEGNDTVRGVLQAFIYLFVVDKSEMFRRWVISGKNVPEKCHICRVRLSFPYYVCKDTEWGFCSDCTKGDIVPTCQPPREEHEHWCITDHRVEKKEKEEVTA